MKTFPLTVVTPDGVCFEGDAQSLLVRTINGDVQIMAGHADLVAALSTGRAAIRTEQGVRFAAVSGGFLTILDGKVTVVCVTFEYADEIDIKRAERAKAKAEAMLREARDRAAASYAKARLARAIARLDVADMI